MGELTGLAEEQRRTLERLRSVPGVAGLYLAGGSAVAFHLRHRRSIDLDLFSLAPDAPLDELRARLVGAFPSTRVLGLSDATLRLQMGDVAVDIVRYPYPPLEPPRPGPAEFPVAGLLDLATMKLAAIARRGIRRDFWDLHAIATQGGVALRRAADAYLTRYGVAEADLYHVLRALTYFADAEKEPVYPAGLTSKHWEEIRRFFRAEAPALLREP